MAQLTAVFVAPKLHQVSNMFELDPKLRDCNIPWIVFDEIKY